MVAHEKRQRRPAPEHRWSSRRMRSADRRPNVSALAQRARVELAELTQLPCQGVTAVRQSGDGTWTVSVELLELSRIPDTDDLLGSYEVDLDEQGEMLGYRRVRRYARSQKYEPQAEPSDTRNGAE